MLTTDPCPVGVAAAEATLPNKGVPASFENTSSAANFSTVFADPPEFRYLM